MKKLNVFLSYAHEDVDMKDMLDKFLINLKRSGIIEVWQDKNIVAGEEWDAAILAALEQADVILLLISADFNASSYIFEKELAIAMQKHKEGRARVIPIILRSCEWEDMPYHILQALPPGAKPVTSYANKDEAYTLVAKGIRASIEALSNNPS